MTAMQGHQALAWHGCAVLLPTCTDGSSVLGAPATASLPGPWHGEADGPAPPLEPGPGRVTNPSLSLLPKPSLASTAYLEKSWEARCQCGQGELWVRGMGIYAASATSRSGDLSALVASTGVHRAPGLGLAARLCCQPRSLRRQVCEWLTEATQPGRLDRGLQLQGLCSLPRAGPTAYFRARALAGSAAHEAGMPLGFWCGCSPWRGRATRPRGGPVPLPLSGQEKGAVGEGLMRRAPPPVTFMTLRSQARAGCWGTVVKPLLGRLRPQWHAWDEAQLELLLTQLPAPCA